MAAVAKTPKEAFTDVRLSKRSAEPESPASGSVRLYVREVATNQVLYAQLADGTEVEIKVLVTGGVLP